MRLREAYPATCPACKHSRQAYIREMMDNPTYRSGLHLGTFWMQHGIDALAHSATASIKGTLLRSCSLLALRRGVPEGP